MKKTKFKPKAIFLMGPTASDKTKIAIMLRQNFPLDIISVDSALIYKGMDIGTAKPTKDQLLRAPHSLLNIIDPSESYSVFDFRRDALNKMIEITYNGKIPLLVGGTMLYFKALLEGLSPLPSPNLHIRQWINQISYQKSWNFLHKLLCNIDIISGKRIHINDHRRISRALEVFFISGKTMTEFSMYPTEILPYEIHKFIIAPTNKENLYKKINIRFKKMLDAGFEEETYNLFKRGDLHENMPSIRCVGYRQMWSYLSGKINYDEMVFQSISATKQLAKHQFTWLRKNPQNWLDSNCSNLILNNIKKIFNKN